MSIEQAATPDASRATTLTSWVRCWRPAWLTAWSLPGAAAAGDLTHKAIALDCCERVLVAVLFGNFAWKILTAGIATFQLNLMLLFMGEVMPVIFVLLRPPSATLSQKPMDWVLAMMGTGAGLLAMPAEVLPLAPATVCMAIIITGLSLQVGAKMTLGFSYGMVAANRGVKVLGPYRFVRHPIYAGYTISHVGGLLAMPSLTNAWLYAAALALQISRIFCEERVLREDAGYRAYAARVRYRLVPGIF